MELVDHKAFPLWAASVVLKKGGKEKEKENYTELGPRAVLLL